MILNERGPDVNVTVQLDHLLLFTLMFAKVMCVSSSTNRYTKRSETKLLLRLQLVIATGQNGLKG